MRLTPLQCSIEDGADEGVRDVIPFPVHAARSQTPMAADSWWEDDSDTDDVLAALHTVSRRINDLARELKCLGYFDDANDRPRAA